jgi:hypothetical protein
VLPCRHEPLAAAVLDGAIGARAASIIARGIDAVADHADLDTLNTVETTLVQCAPSLTTRELARVTRTLPDRFNPDGAEPRADQLRARAKVTMRKLPSGIIRFIADMPRGRRLPVRRPRRPYGAAAAGRFHGRRQLEH